MWATVPGDTGKVVPVSTIDSLGGVVYTGTIWASGIRIRWADTDFLHLLPSPTSSLAVPEHTTPTAEGIDQNALPPTISNTTRIAIGVTAPVLVIGFIIMGVLLYRRRRRANDEQTSGPGVPELDSGAGDGQHRPKGPSYSIHELATPTTVPIEAQPKQADQQIQSSPQPDTRQYGEPGIPRALTMRPARSTSVEGQERPSATDVNAADITPVVLAAPHSIAVDAAAAGAEDEEIHQLREEREKVRETGKASEVGGIG